MGNDANDKKDMKCFQFASEIDMPALNGKQQQTALNE